MVKLSFLLLVSKVCVQDFFMYCCLLLHYFRLRNHSLNNTFINICIFGSAKAFCLVTYFPLLSIIHFEKYFEKDYFLKSRVTLTLP